MLPFSITDKTSKKTTIFYIRHGQSESNAITSNQIVDNESITKNLVSVDPNITELGEKQAKATATYLFNQLPKNSSNITIIQTPLKRTQQTALPFISLLKDHNINYKLITNEISFEYIAQHKEIPPELSDKIEIDSDWSWFWWRARLFNQQLREMMDQDSESIYVVFGHGLFLSLLIAFQMSQETIVMSSPKISVDLFNCSISKTEFIQNDKIDSTWRWCLCIINYIDHLSKDLLIY